MAVSYCDQAALEIALGGADVLVQLSDFNRDGTADATVVTDYLESGAAQVRASVEVKHDPEAIAALDADSLRRLRDANASLSAAIAWRKGGRGQGVPVNVLDQVTREERFLSDLRSGAERLGRISGGISAAINQPATVVDYDSDASGISIAAFKRGFR